MRSTFTRYGAFVAVFALLTSCSKEELVTPSSGVDSITSSRDAVATQNDNLAMGNPSGATASTSMYYNYLMSKPQYSLSYHRDRGTPNWVSWHLSSAWVGSAPRQDDFRADPALPNGWYRPTTSSYTGSGFDRGHNCPSADRTYTLDDNSATFLMTNMMPQAANNNQRAWASLESYCRTLTNAGNELYIVCGSYGRGGTGVNGYKETIDQGRITVPARCWKVILVLPNGSNDVSRVTTSTRVIAIDTPNDNSIGTSWGAYRTTVDAIEARTGYNLFSAVSATVQSAIEAKVDTGLTS